MISLTDSFIQYLSANLSAPPVAYVRATENDPTSSDLQMNTLNVSILSFQEDGSSETALISLDIVGSDERTVFDWAKAVRDLLLSVQYTPELDFEASPGSPASTGRMVSWDARSISFHLVRKTVDRNVHLNATFPISHVRQ